MRLLVGSAIFMVVLLAAAIYITHETLVLINQFRDELSSLMELVNSGKWFEAQDKAAKLQRRWNQMQDWWDLYIFHTDIEAIEVTLARLISFIDSKEQAAGLAELAELDMHFSHIYRNEMFNLQNVL